jgi:hypothetical protein
VPTRHPYPMQGILCLVVCMHLPCGRPPLCEKKEASTLDIEQIEELGGLHYHASCRRANFLTRADITSLEAKLGHTFPEEYVAFLLAHPEGPFYCGYSICFVYGPEKQRSFIDSFYSITTGRNCPGFDLWWNYKCYAGEKLPPYLVPITGDAAGDYVCLSLSPQRYGCVFYWDHELADYTGTAYGEGVTEEEVEGLCFLASSLTAFFSLLEVSK